MLYDTSLIIMTNKLALRENMYSLVCLKADALHITLNQAHCFLDGHYLLCLSVDDTLCVRSGYYEAMNLHFLPYFYNVNLNHSVINIPLYEEMRTLYGYPDFTLFLNRTNDFLGILSLSAQEYEQAHSILSRAARHIDNHPFDPMWSCRTRSEMISLLQLAEGSAVCEEREKGNEILRYIRNNPSQKLCITGLCERFHTNRTSLTKIIRSHTGLSPMQYVLEERLNQSRPDLLFTYIPISEIALKYGFTDVNYYVRAFKKRFGITPLQYRTAGRAERIRNENYYHEKEKQYIKEKEKKQ